MSDEDLYAAILVGGPNDGLTDFITALPLAVTTRHCEECQRPHVQVADDQADPLYVLVDASAAEVEATYLYSQDLVDDELSDLGVPDFWRTPVADRGGSYG